MAMNNKAKLGMAMGILVGLFFWQNTLAVKAHIREMKDESPTLNGKGGHENIDNRLKELLQRHEVEEVKDLDCDSLGADEFEVLGEWWMGIRHPNEKVHEMMDKMMGGEGSQGLRQAHARMGKGYLGCVNNFSTVEEQDNNEDQIGLITNKEKRRMLGMGLVGVLVLIIGGYLWLGARFPKNMKKGKLLIAIRLVMGGIMLWAFFDKFPKSFISPRTAILLLLFSTPIKVLTASSAATGEAL